MVLVKTVKLGHVFVFCKSSQKNVFDNILETENAFKTIKNEMLKKSIHWDYSKGVSPWFWSKM